MDIKGASAIVTGGAGGFGEATVRRLVDKGAKVVIADLHDDRANALAKELGSSVQYVRTDITDEQNVIEAINAAQEMAPLRVAVAVHGGMGGPGGGASRMVDRHGVPIAMDAFRFSVEIFLIGHFTVISRAAAVMSQNEADDDNQRGVCIGTASIAGFEGQVGQVPYSAAKGGVIGMTLTAARDMGPAGIRIMTIAPGTFHTYAYGDTPLEQLNERFASLIPNPKRMGRADEYAQLAMQIVENNFLNGYTIRLDGAQRF
ncbi:MAG: SDR family NAD(P)-dependent oxidoreductase [Actinomycetota bacterium]|nr:SDR family NAD(P)-dependent oxidoreductase [Actinomycetota bacterium]